MKKDEEGAVLDDDVRDAFAVVTTRNLRPDGASCKPGGPLEIAGLHGDGDAARGDNTAQSAAVQPWSKYPYETYTGRDPAGDDPRLKGMWPNAGGSVVPMDGGSGMYTDAAMSRGNVNMSDATVSRGDMKTGNPKTRAPAPDVYGVFGFDYPSGYDFGPADAQPMETTGYHTGNSGPSAPAVMRGADVEMTPDADTEFGMDVDMSMDLSADLDMGMDAQGRDGWAGGGADGLFVGGRACAQQ